MYEFLLNAHNIIRWILLLVIIFVLIRSWSGFLGKKPYEKLDKAIGGVLIGFTHTQLILGVILLIVSPLTQAAFSDFGAAMKDPVLRYPFEHAFVMIVAVVLIQIGRTLSKRATDPVKKHKAIALYTTIAVLLILSRIPNWSFMH